MTIGQKSGKLVFFVDLLKLSMIFSNDVCASLNGTTYYFVANLLVILNFMALLPNPAKATIFTLCTKIVGSRTHYVITNTKLQ